MNLSLNVAAVLFSLLYNLTIGYAETTVSTKDLNLITDPDLFRNVSEIISSKGYPVHDHVVQTKDGYLLSMQRIPHGKMKSSKCKKRVVLLQHGMVGSSVDWVLNFPHQSLGFILADTNYDVWLGNARGNTYSKHHVKLKPSDKQFWNFSFDEMARYDLPAMIDYILNVTGEKDLIYVGHSQGTTSAFALLSESSEFNQKMKLLIALSPVMNLGGMKTPMKHLVPYATELRWFLNLFGGGEFSVNKATSFCSWLGKNFCDEMIFSMLGKDKKQLNETRQPVYVAHLDSTSTKSLLHYAQLFLAERFQKFDYGKQNLQHYGQVNPPEYDITKIRTPTALFWAANDFFVEGKNIKSLERKLKYLVKSYRIPFKDFTHWDFLVALDAHSLLYDEVLALMEKFAKS